MKYLSLTAALLASVALTAPAFAADTKPVQPQAPAQQQGQLRPEHKGRFEHMLEKMDTNKDGSISKAEFLAAGDARFTKMDRNGDGKLDAADKPEPRKGMDGKPEAGKGPPPPPPQDDDAPPPRDDVPPQEME